MTTINFHNIRTHRNSQNSGFEELCCQIAFTEFADQKDWKFQKKGGSADGGVECFWILPDKSEYCFQAKYVDDLESALKQVDKSIATALEKHPNVKKYFICLSTDFADSRKGGDVTERKKWDNHLTKWEGWASAKGMQVEFIPWGQFELTNFLTKNTPDYIGKRAYWFNETLLDKAWFKRSLDSVLKEAGPRYTPELHIELPELHSKFHALSRDKKFYAEITKLENTFGSAFGRINIKTDLAKKYPNVSDAARLLNDNCKKLKNKFVNFAFKQTIPQSILNEIEECAEEIRQCISKLEALFYDVQKQEREVRQNEGKSKESYHRETFENDEYYLRLLRQNLYQLTNFLDEENEGGLWKNRFLILRGKAGVGKTHTLYDFAEERIKNGLPTVMVLGQSFKTNSDPWTQLLDRLGLSGMPRDSFLGALNSAAEAENSTGLIIIDALNEGKGRDFWPTRLASFASEIKQFKNLCFIVSIRDTYFAQNIPPNIENVGATIVDHPGFSGVEYKATTKFFQHFNIKLPSTPLLNPEFLNPLFLKIFCEGIRDANLHEVPLGMNSISKVFDFFLDQKFKKISSDLSYDPKDNLLPKVISALAKEMAKNKQRWVSREKAKELVSKISKKDNTSNFSESLFYHLLSENLIVEVMGYDEKYESIDAIGFSYERFSDHIIAADLLNDIKPDSTLFSLRRRFNLTPILKEVLAGNYVPNGWVEALTMQIPEKTDFELIDIIGPKALFNGSFTEKITRIADHSFFYRNIIARRLVGLNKARHHTQKLNSRRSDIIRAFKETIIWRSPESINEETVTYLNSCSPSIYEVIEVLFALATTQNHILNADRLHKILMKPTMPERDAAWGTKISLSGDEDSSVFKLIDWGFTQNLSHIDSKSLELAAVAICWTLISSNRALRDKATKALTNIFSFDLQNIPKILQLFSKCDDLYVIERIYAAVYGAFLIDQGKSSAALEDTSRWIFDAQFKNKSPSIHLMIRDYAACIISYGISQGFDPNESNQSKHLPPYKSTWPIHIPTVSELEKYFIDEPEEEKRNRRGLFSIRWSVLNGGDFAKYNIDNLHHWYNIPRDSDGPIRNEDRAEKILSKLDDSEKAVITPLLKELEQHISSGVSKFFFRYSPETGQFIENIRWKDTDGSHEEINHTLREKENEIISFVGSKIDAEDLKSIRKYLQDPARYEKFPLYPTEDISHWVCNKIFELGWDEELFNDFDSQRETDRSQNVKIERIGKKYAWIALAEISAILNDNLMFCSDRYNDQPPEPYRGAWQLDMRDVDPTLIISNLSDLNYKTSPVTWWQPYHCEFDLEAKNEQLNWVKDDRHVPIGENMILSRDNAGIEWVTGRSYYSWYETKRTGDDGRELPYRNVWVGISCFLIEKKDFETLKVITEKATHAYDWMPRGELRLRQTFIGEFPNFGPSLDLLKSDDTDSINDDWDENEENVVALPTASPIKTFCDYDRVSDYDGSSENTSANIPSKALIDLLGLQRTGKTYDYKSDGEIAAFCPHTHEYGAPAFLIKRDILFKRATEKKYVICWGLSGEKMLLGHDTRGEAVIKVISGFYWLDESGNIQGTSSTTLDR